MPKFILYVFCFLFSKKVNRPLKVTVEKRKKREIRKWHTWREMNHKVSLRFLLYIRCLKTKIFDNLGFLSIAYQTYQYGVLEFIFYQARLVFMRCCYENLLSKEFCTTRFSPIQQIPLRNCILSNKEYIFCFSAWKRDGPWWKIIREAVLKT